MRLRARAFELVGHAHHAKQTKIDSNAADRVADRDERDGRAHPHLRLVYNTARTKFVLVAQPENDGQVPAREPLPFTLVVGPGVHSNL